MDGAKGVAVLLRAALVAQLLRVACAAGAAGAASAAASAPHGANFSPCRRQAQCAGERQCLALVALTAPPRCTPGEYCACVPRGEAAWRCADDGGCAPFESCEDMPSIFMNAHVCVDLSQLRSVRSLRFCDVDADCAADGRVCVVLDDGLGVCAAPLPRADAVIVPATDRAPVDAAADAADAADDSGAFQASDALQESDALEDSDVLEDIDWLEGAGGRRCIAAHHLEAQRARGELLYGGDAAAWVLCDAHGSCATRGHMVLFRGRAMMMRTYCATAAAARCRRRRMAVNSVRWRRGASVPSRTPQLRFSALAARFGSRAEERVLAAAIALGL